MKVFLANPPCRIKLKSNKEKFFVRAGSRWPFSVVKKPEEPADYLPFPFYLAYTAALLEKAGHEVIVNDSVALNETEAEFLRKAAKVKPEIILFETSTPTIDYDLKLVKKIRKKLGKTIICLAGSHATTFFKEVLRQAPGVDFVFLAEYELNFAKLVKNLSIGKNAENIPGIAFKKARRIYSQKPELIDPLDRLPSPARHLFPSNENPDPTLYWDGFCQKKPAIQMHASRGCPFRCNFCLWNQVMYRNSKYRVFSAKRVVDEMEQVIANYAAQEIYFDDDTFTANKKHVLALCREIKKRGLDVAWSVMGDAMITDKEMIDAMADAGCIGAKFGVESGNQEILKHIEKPVKFARLREFTNWCAQRRIKTHATFTFGLSGETKETMAETLELAKSLNVDSVQFSITTPFPGTRYFNDLKKRKLLDYKGWEDFDGSLNSVVRFENLSQKEVKKMFDQASSFWLRHKLKDYRWLIRQTYNFWRLLNNQGPGAAFKKAKRVFQLIF
jgi:radical SAM superfamily enzyme YgiQ (UPF0313 family)